MGLGRKRDKKEREQREGSLCAGECCRNGCEGDQGAPGLPSLLQQLQTPARGRIQGRQTTY